MAQDVLFRYPEFCAAGCFVFSRQSLTLIFILATFYSSAWAAGDWAVLHETGSGNTCVLQSKPAPVYDGYQESIATLVVYPKSLYVVPKSVFDSSFGDLGMQMIEG
jgi:hypothetical protein